MADMMADDPDAAAEFEANDSDPSFGQMRR